MCVRALGFLRFRIEALGSRVWMASSGLKVCWLEAFVGESCWFKAELPMDHSTETAKVMEGPK